MRTGKDHLHITMEGVGKRFYQRWLFRGLQHDFSQGPRLALIGTNGSGKSTLMRMLAGQMTPTEGKIRYRIGGKLIPASEWYRYISWSAPYVSMYADLTLREHLALHFRFKACLLDNQEEVVHRLNLQAHADKPLRVYSSGMLQRVKVGTALFSDSRVLLLDEPTSNMDQANATYMLDLIEQHKGERTLILASNLEREFGSFADQLRLGLA